MEINGKELLYTDAAVLAVGHSARDTFETLYRHSVPMEAKAFAVGLRIQHPQAMINMSQYGMEECSALGPASYKLTRQTTAGRGVYSFCMCPGGYVVNASSEPGRLAVNGMSYHDRAGENANSAIIVSVTPEDFSHDNDEKNPLSGIYFQRTGGKGVSGSRRKHPGTALWRFLSRTALQITLARFGRLSGGSMGLRTCAGSCRRHCLLLL